MIHLKWIIFSVITLAYIISLVVHLTLESGGMWWSGKKKGELGFWGLVLTVCYVVILLIYGGVFWW